jgi:GTPase
MLAIDKRSDTKLATTFRAEINVFSGHHTTIKTGFTALCNIGTVRASAKFSLDGTSGSIARSGDRIIVELSFATPICLMLGSEFIFREGMSVGHGHILEAVN